jgi:hypothetical protein
MFLFHIATATSGTQLQKSEPPRIAVKVHNVCDSERQFLNGASINQSKQMAKHGCNESDATHVPLTLDLYCGWGLFQVHYYYIWFLA